VSGGQGQTTVTGTATGNRGQIAIGTNIRQQTINLIVQVDSGDPASLEKLAKAIKFEPMAERVTDWDRDFPVLIGRDATVVAAQHAFAARSSIVVFGEEGMGKSVLLRHLARRGTADFAAGVVIVPAASRPLWLDIGQDLVKAFYHADLPVELGPTELRRLLSGLPAVILLDDVQPAAGIDQLYAMCESASFVVTSVMPLLAGEVDGIELGGLDPSAAGQLASETLARAGGGGVDSETAIRIGAALRGKPSEIIRVVQDAARRKVPMTTLAEQLADPVQARIVELTTMTPSEQATVDGISALSGTPVGPEHVVAAVPEATTVTVSELLARGKLRAASPQVRLDPDLATVRATEPHVNPDPIRERFLDHFIEWAGKPDRLAVDVAQESRAILFLLGWAERTGRTAEVLRLSASVEGALSLAGGWGAWELVTGFRLRAAEARKDHRAAAIALNQQGVQALAHDAPDRARGAFAAARERARTVQAADVARVAGRNLRLIDGLLANPGQKTDEQTDVREHLGPKPDPKGFPWPLVLGGVALLGILAAILFLFLFNRVALAIDPPTRDLAAATVQADGQRATFTVSNAGGGTIETLEVTLIGDGADEFFIVGGDCPGATLRAGASCSVVVLFHPTRAGAAAATIKVAAKSGTVVTASIRGQASDPTPAPTPSPTPIPSAGPTKAPKGQPDLAIGEFVPTGTTSLGDFYEIPVRAVVVNAGLAEAGSFTVVITADDRPVPFAVEGSDPVDVETRSPLGPKGSVEIDGVVQLDRGTQLDTVRLVVHADSCLRDPSSRKACRIAESNELNNSYRLQSVDLQVSNLKLGVPQEPVGNHLVEPSAVEVPISFDIRNAGPEDAGAFWIASRSGQLLAILQVDGYDLDQNTFLLRVPGLAAGESRHLEGVAYVARTSVDLDLTIAIGCPPGSEPCQIPEIAFENNVASGTIPQPTPAPVGAIFTAKGE
jgi:hypothetical protein